MNWLNLLLPALLQQWLFENAIKAVRGQMGATNPLDSVPGSIRGDYALTIGENIVHGSDSEESAAREIKNFFKAEEIY